MASGSSVPGHPLATGHLSLINGKLLAHTPRAFAGKGRPGTHYSFGNHGSDRLVESAGHR